MNVKKARKHTGGRMNPMGERTPVDLFTGMADVNRQPVQEVLQNHSTAHDETRALPTDLMERITELSNLTRAFDHVRSNGGSPGVDGMKVEVLPEWFPSNYANLQKQLLSGKYQPQPVKGVQIPKPKGGFRQLGIPTVIDRGIQEAIRRILGPILNAEFSQNSFGYRPGLSGQDAVKRASAHAQTGKRYVIDLDIEKFFDKVNHDRLLWQLSRRIGDKRVLQLIGKYLRSGMMQDGLVSQRTEGTPQGGPLSPLLSNLVLHELDDELEKRGHRFVRYADDIKIFVASPKAAARVAESVTRFIEGKLKLKISKEKSRICKPYELNFLGHTILAKGRVGLSKESEEKLKSSIRKITRRNRGISLESMIEELNPKFVGWVNYFRYALMGKKLERLEGWIRRKLRCVRLKQCKRTHSIMKFLKSLGLEEYRCWLIALSGKGWWRLSSTPAVNEGMNIEWFARLGLISLTAQYIRVNS